MKYFDHYIDAFRKYAVVSGRANRAQYWWFVLFSVLIAAGLGVIDSIIMPRGEMGAPTVSPLNSLYNLAVLVPSIAIAVRRLHDTGRSGWWLLIGLIPFIGWIVVIVFLVLGSQGANQYGPAPAGAVPAQTPAAAPPAEEPPAPPEGEQPPPAQ